MANHRVSVDHALPLAKQPECGHNRWHPDIRPILKIASGDRVILETLDSFDGQILPTTNVDDLRSASLYRVHPLTGPVYVEGANAGDLLKIQIEDVITPTTGFTVIMPGFGFLRDLFPEPYILHWETANGVAVSPQMPGVRIPGAPFMGIMGLCPSHDLMRSIKAREKELYDRGGAVMLPDATSAVPSDPRIAADALRTITPHETGGNIDIKQIVAGTTLYLPVSAEGGLFSVGDAHFAQGDGESCGTAIETSATFVARFEVLKGEATRRKQNDPSFSRDDYFVRPEIAVPRRFYATTGLSVRRDGRNESEDITIAARNALLNMLEYITDAYSMSREQAYCLASVAVDLKISQVVDVPNMVVSAFLPLDIFERG
jgi:formamidase